MTGFLMFMVYGVIVLGIGIRNIRSQKAIGPFYKPETGAKAVAQGYQRVWLGVTLFAVSATVLLAPPALLFYFGWIGWIFVSAKLSLKYIDADEKPVRKRKRKPKSTYEQY